MSVPAVITMIGVLITALAAYYKEVKEKKHLFVVLILVGVIISALGTLWSSWRQDIQAENLETLNKKLVERSEKIANLNQEIMCLMTGCDSFPYLWLTLSEDMPNEPLLVVTNVGDYPLYDVTLTLLNAEDLQRMKRNIQGEERISFANFKRAQKFLRLGTFFPHANVEFGQFPFSLEDSDYHSYGIAMRTQFGLFSQRLQLKLISKGQWTYAARVLDSQGQTIFKAASPDFPSELMDADESLKEIVAKIVEFLPEENEELPQGF